MVFIDLTIEPKRLKRRLTQSAVAIPALGWRLRVGATANLSLRIQVKAGHAADLLGSGGCRTATGGLKRFLRLFLSIVVVQRLRTDEPNLWR